MTGGGGVDVLASPPRPDKFSFFAWGTAIFTGETCTPIPLPLLRTLGVGLNIARRNFSSISSRVSLKKNFIRAGPLKT